MKVALITDTHFGVRNDSQVHLNDMSVFLKKQFFPYLKKHDIDEVYHLGDLVDRRKYVSFATAARMRFDFLEVFAAKDIYLRIIAGNHDEFFKNTHEINALRELVQDRYGDHVKMFDEPTDFTFFDGHRVLLLPWITPETEVMAADLIKTTQAQIVFGHVGLRGFEMHRGIVAGDDERDPAIFKKFDVSCFGHFHHKSSAGGIHYLGAPCEFTWNDYNDPRGFHVFDTKTRELEFIRNERPLHVKLHYDDTTEDFNPDKMDFSKASGKIVKVVVHKKENTFWFESFMDKLEETNPADVTVVEDHLNLGDVSDEDVAGDIEDNEVMLKRYAAALAEARCLPPEQLERLIIQLHSEALALD